MKPILIIATDGFEQSELTEPKRLLEEAGTKVMVAKPRRRRDQRAGKTATGAIASQSICWSAMSRPTITPRCCCRADR